MKNKIEKVFFNMLIFLIVLYFMICVAILYLLQYKKFAVILLISSVFVGIIFVCFNSIRVGYFFAKKKKALIYAEVTNFKLLKLYYGNKVANQMFDQVTSIIKSFVPTGNVKIKYGRNYVILAEYNSKSDLVSLINKINNEVEKIKCDEMFNLVINYGIQICDDAGYESNENRAELACNLAKKDSLSTYQFYNNADFEHQLEEKMILNELINALKSRAFEVYYQPKYDCKERKIVGSEALIRLKKNNQVVSAHDFIEVAEKYDFIVLLDKYVLKVVCKKIQDLKKKKLDFNTISVNVSRNTLRSKDMIEYYSKMLDEYGIKKNEIEFEITERDSDATDDLSDVIHDLCKKFNVSIDDFGIGSSSLAMLTGNKIKTIKIDRRFVKDDSEKGREILNNIISLAKRLELNIVAEGVENKEQHDYLKSKGCTIMQGYYFSKPLSYDEYEEVLKEGL